MTRHTKRALEVCSFELGKEKFGSPPTEIENSIRSTEDLKKLFRMTKRILTATSWAELLDTP